MGQVALTVCQNVQIEDPEVILVSGAILGVKHKDVSDNERHIDEENQFESEDILQKVVQVAQNFWVGAIHVAKNRQYLKVT